MKKLLNTLFLLNIISVPCISISACAACTAENQKKNLSNISWRGMNKIKADTEKFYQNIDCFLYNQVAKLKGKNLKSGFTVEYFRDEKGQKKINIDDKQVVGDIWVKITAAADDPHWTGSTQPLKITLVERADDLLTDLNTVTSLAGMDPIVVDTSST